jgi:membrane protease subunit HflC
VFVVDQRSYAIVVAFGKVRDRISTPGLYFKLPAPLQNVVYLDNRILTVDTTDAAGVLTSEKKRLLVDAFVKWRIANPEQFFLSFSGDEGRARDRIGDIVRAALNEEIPQRSVHDVIAGPRAAFMDAVRKKVAADAGQIGMEIVDVRLRRVRYVDQLNNAVFERMKAERLRTASELRSTGAAEAEQIKADADRQRTTLAAEAFRDAERIKGEGDARASQIYAQSFGKNPEFYRFYRSMEAYRATFKNRSDVIVLDPSSDFFKYFKSPGAAK